MTVLLQLLSLYAIFVVTVLQDLFCAFGHLVSGQRDLQEEVDRPRRGVGCGTARGPGYTLRPAKGNMSLFLYDSIFHCVWRITCVCQY